ncbi:MAG: glycosyltransferase family 2 protein [Pontiellaceae bacterium]|jgi:dolichol-phosphate mannosyltransferase|nr:glycosyltransferase family 2 protein [Pontiellaceae bacterium]
MKNSVAIVVPFLNEEENLPELYRRLTAVFEKRSETAAFLFVDDGSTDGSVHALEKLRQNDPRIRILQLSRNFGHQIAITAGMDYADADAVVIIDADLQDPPETIADLLDKWHDGFEVVYAVRKSREGETWIKRFLAASFYRIFHQMAKVNVPMDAGDFRLVDRKVVDALKNVRELHRFMRGLTCWVGFRQCAVEYDRAARHAGETKYPVWKSLRLAADAITSFSALPLRLMTVMGALIALCGFIQGMWVIVGRIINPDSYVSGWATVVALILFMAGVQLLCLGLVGQYISRIFDETKRRPLYFLR